MKTLLRTLILLLVRFVGLPKALAARRTLRTAPGATTRILLIRPDHLGDLVMTTPVIDAIRQHAPHAQITMMVGPWSREVVARHPAIDQIITCPFPGFQRTAQQPLTPYTLLFSTARQLRRQHYDLAINLRPDFWWGAALLYLAAIPRRVGYAIEPGTPFLTHAPTLPPYEHSTVSNLRLASVGLQTIQAEALAEPFTPARYPLHFVPTHDEQLWVSQRLRLDAIDEQTTVIAIHPGTGGPVKLWRNEAWIALANQLTRPTLFPAPIHIVLTGSPSEQLMLNEIAQGLDRPATILTDLTVGQLAALLQRAQLVLGVDNGPLHLATAQDTPTVRLFGPTDPRIYGPWGAPERHLVLSSTQRCPGCPFIPCNRLDFTPDELALHPCVRLIPEERVYQAIATQRERVRG